MSNNLIDSAIRIALVITATLGVGSAIVIPVGPGESIQSAIDASNEGDTILVKSGVYHENLNIDKRLTLKGEDTDGMPEIDAGGDGDGITSNADEVTVRGFVVTNARTGIYVASRNNTIVENEVRDSWTGIYLLSSAGNILKENEVRDSWRGIYLKNSENNALYDNRIVGNRWSAIVLESSEGNFVSENLIHDNYRGFELINSDENMFKDNEMQNNKYNDEPISNGPEMDLIDIMGGPSAEPLEPPSDEESRTELVSETEGAMAIGGETENGTEDGIAINEPRWEVSDEDMVIGSINATITAKSRNGTDPAEPMTEEVQVVEGSEIEYLTLDREEVPFEPIDGEKTNETVYEEDFVDVEYEGTGQFNASGKDLLLPQNSSQNAIEPVAVDEGLSSGEESGVLAEDSVSEPVLVARVEDLLERDGIGTEQIDERPSDTPEETALAVEADASLEETVAEAAINDTSDEGFVYTEDSSMSKSNSGGWKIYEYLKSLGETTSDKEIAAPLEELKEMNISEMADMELERLDLGTIAFYSPKEMTVGVSQKVEAAVAKDVQRELAEGIRGHGVSETEVAQIKASIIADLEGDNFLILPLDDDENSEVTEGISQWAWDVTPLKSGLWDLTLKVAVVVETSDGAEIRKDYPIQERRIGVDLSLRHIVLYLIDRVGGFTTYLRTVPISSFE